jgi:NADH:ubiquinone reductase (non-electrogenic)
MSILTRTRLNSFQRFLPLKQPIRSFEHNTGEIIVGEASDFDPANKTVFVQFEGETLELRYQTLVVAAGAATATYGIPGVAEHCMYMKEMKDARALRERILFQFEHAAHLEGAERVKALTFVFVGGGPTGIETACELVDLIEMDLKKDFPDLVSQARIVIVEAGKEILTVFDRTLVQYALKKLKQKGIVVRTQSAVKAVEEGRAVLANGEVLEADTIVWAAGNAPNPFIQSVAKRLNAALDHGRLKTDHALNVIGGPDHVYAIGDCAIVYDEKGQALPATGQVAMKQGSFLGRVLSEKSHEHFRFSSMGMLASLGTGAAIADLGTVQFKGYFAWWFWKTAYLTRLISARNKISVAFDWIRVRLFGRNTARIDF